MGHYHELRKYWDWNTSPVSSLLSEVINRCHTLTSHTDLYATYKIAAHCLNGHTIALYNKVHSAEHANLAQANLKNVNISKQLYIKF